VLNRAYRTDSHGLNFGVDWVNCPVPVAASNTNCSMDTSISGSLGWSAEGLVAFASTYAYNGDAATKAAADAMYNQMWAKPGTCPAGSTVCNETVTAGNNYLTQLDLSVDGFMLQGTPPPAKWFGQYFGFGDYSAWPAVRLGGAQEESSQAAYVDFDLKTVPGATRVRAIATLPNGDTRETECASAPCVIDVDPRQGAYDLDLTYLSSDGRALSATSAHRSVGF